MRHKNGRIRNIENSFESWLAPCVENVWERKKITPNIVNMLSKHELENLKVTFLAHMMTMRMKCIKYGNMKPREN